jgi:hypothetical protein
MSDVSLLTRVKYWFISLKSVDELTKKFKGRVGTSEAFLNLFLAALIAELVLVLISLVYSSGVYSSGAEINFEVSKLVVLGFALIFSVAFKIIFWFVLLSIYHVSASILGGRGNYAEYLGIASFPVAGILFINIISAPLLCAIRFCDFSYLILLFLFIVISRITQEEYGLSTIKSVFVVVVVPILVSILLILFLFSLMTIFNIPSSILPRA